MKEKGKEGRARKIESISELHSCVHLAHSDSTLQQLLHPSIYYACWSGLMTTLKTSKSFTARVSITYAWDRLSVADVTRTTREVGELCTNKEPLHTPALGRSCCRLHRGLPPAEAEPGQQAGRFDLGSSGDTRAQPGTAQPIKG